MQGVNYLDLVPRRIVSAEPGENDGQVVLLNFWGTWCPPCREEMPHLQDLWSEVTKTRKDVEFLAINFGEIRISSLSRNTERCRSG